MEERNKLESLEESVPQSMDNIYGTLERMGGKWKTDTIPLNLIKRTLEVSKLKLEGDPSKSEIIFQDAYNKTLDAIYSHLSEGATSLGVVQVPLLVIKEVLEFTKSEFIKGLLEPEKGKEEQNDN